MAGRGPVVVVALAAVVLVAGCATGPVGGPATSEGASAGASATATPDAGIDRPPDDHFADTVSGDEGDGPRVEQAFRARVMAIDDGGPAPWITFEVERWFTDDLGDAIALWAPGFDGGVGEDWLVAATRYQFGDRPIGDVLVGESTPFDAATLAEWEQEWGGSVAPGGDVAEATAAPDVLATIEQARARWEDQEPDDWTATLTWWERGTVYGECGSGPVRVVVHDGVVTEAIDLDADCDVDDPPTISAMFDRAVQVAGALEEPPRFDDTWGFPTSFSAWDRSVEVGLGVDDFAPEVRPLARGPQDEALAEARARWDAAGIGDYTIVVEPACFCGFQGVVEVDVVAGEQVAVRPREPDLTAADYDGLDLTVDAIFDAIAASIASGTVDVAYDPDLGHPTWASLDPVVDGVDDETTYRVLSVAPAGTR